MSILKFRKSIYEIICRIGFTDNLLYLNVVTNLDSSFSKIIRANETFWESDSKSVLPISPYFGCSMLYFRFRNCRDSRLICQERDTIYWVGLRSTIVGGSFSISCKAREVTLGHLFSVFVPSFNVGRFCDPRVCLIHCRARNAFTFCLSEISIDRRFPRGTQSLMTR